ncbi:MAG: hypothetical protein R3F59_18635 [Myxococcota bacterium]
MSRNAVFGSPLLLGLALVLPQSALAGKIVLAPLIADDTVDAKQRLGVHQLLSSELDFAPEVSGVVDLSAPPPTLNEPCLGNAKCLQGIAAANGGEQVLSGKLTGAGDKFTLDLVYYDGSKIARHKAFTVPQDPTGLANAMTPIVREILTGAGSQQEQAAAQPKASDFDMDDDVALGAAAGLAGGAAIGAMSGSLSDLPDDVPPVRDVAPLETAPTPAESKGRKGGDRRMAAASVATGLATGGAAATSAMSSTASAPPPPPAPSAEDLARTVSFANTANQITAEQIDAMVQFGPPPGSGTPMPQPTVRGSGGTSDDLAREEAELESLDGGIPDLDGPSRRTKPPGGGAKGGGGGGDIGHVVQLTARGGYSRYYTFDFFTGGGEFAVAAAKGFHLLAGVELYAVERELPPDVASAVGIAKEWNFIFPLNVGAIYKFPVGIVQPYVGADTIFVQYYKDEVGADWAVGGRARAGADFMVHPNFGFNVNFAAGVWSGQNWGLIEQGVGQTGFLPQVSLGTVVAF